MADVNINKFRASVVRDGSKPASPGFIVSEGQDPVDPAGNGQNHLPVTIATAATGLSITDSQVLGGAGNVGQYIRGDGSLADFPQASGGGSSVSYYLNGSISQGTIGGVAYKELNKVPILGAGTDFTINADGYIASFLTDAGDPNLLEIPGGNWNFETYFSASSGGGSPSFYVELYKYDGTTFTLIASSSSSPELIAFGTNLNPYFSTLAVPTTTLALTDRLAIRYYVTHSGRTITLHTENNHLCQVVTTFTTGLTSLNGLTAQVQNLAVGTSGTDFNIASATATHTFNLPTASATNRGALSSADWTTFNNKQNALGYVPVPETRTITINGVSQDLSANRTYNVGTVTSVGLSSATSGVTIGSSPVTSSGTITLAIATASGSQNGLLSSTDWTTFNSKQNALTNPVTGTGTTNYLPKFTGASTIGNSLFTDNGTNGGIGGANYTSGTGLRSFNISAQDYPGLSFWANNQQTASIFGLGFTGSLNLDADPGNIFLNSRIVMSTDGTERLTIFNDGNVSIGNSPTNNGAKFQVSGTATISGDLGVGRIPSSGYKVDIQGNGGLRILDNDILRSIILTPPTSAGAAANVESTSANGLNLNSSNASGFVTISTAGSTRLTIASTGAATFSSSVTANGISSIGQEQAFTWQRTTGTASDVYSLNADGSSAYLYNNTTAKVLMYWAEGGNVGIGVTSLVSPGASRRLLQISNSTNGSLIALGSSTSESNNPRIFSGQYDLGFAAGVTTGNIVFYTNDQLRLTIASTGAATFTGNINQNINDGAISLYKSDGTTLKAFIGNLNGTTTDEGYLALYKTNVQKVAIRASGTSYFDGGNVLIGTTTDIGERLTLNGRIGIVGSTVASGNSRSFFVRGAQTVADGGTLTLSVTNSALIFIAENNTGTGALFFCGYASATITKISDPSNMFDVADTAGKLCIFKSATTDVATVKNRLGSSKSITVTYIGVSD